MSEENTNNNTDNTEENKQIPPTPEAEQAQAKKVEEQKEAIKKDAKGLWLSATTFLHELLDFRQDTDRESTIELIKADIPFKGATAWILICSIFVASIGLNANSIPVVIGAMLISPLMGPILGIGLSIAINDIDTLRKSLINFGVMIGLSIITAFLFFYLFPLKEESSELLARTRPDIRDVLIAFFGGAALIIARTKKGTIASVIFGVAIATALMPPLCTVGFGLAIGKYEYALGALYLFTINTIFIALATFIVLKLLRFPMLRYANSIRRKRIAQLASFVAILAMVPAGVTFWHVWQTSNLEGDIRNYIKDEITANDNLYLYKHTYDLNDKVLRLYFSGEISEVTESDLRKELIDYKYIQDFKLDINGNKARGIDQVSKAYDRAIVEIERMEVRNKNLEKTIDSLSSQIVQLKSQLAVKDNNGGVIPFNVIAKDAKIRFSGLETIGFAKVLRSNFLKVDTVAVIFPKWKSSVPDSIIPIENVKLKGWIKSELKVGELEVH
ncbi:DUF389 domain-containing protein [Aquimarina rhabdastrellae]